MSHETYRPPRATMHIGTMLDPDLVEWLDNEAERRRTTRSALIRDLLLMSRAAILTQREREGSS